MTALWYVALRGHDGIIPVPWWVLAPPVAFLLLMLVTLLRYHRWQREEDDRIFGR